MHRRHFLQSLVAAVALSPVLARMSGDTPATVGVESGPWMRLDFGYWIKEQCTPTLFGVEVHFGHEVQVSSPKQKTAWILKEGVHPFYDSENLFIHGGVHRLISVSDMLARWFQDNEKWIRETHAIYNV